MRWFSIFLLLCSACTTMQPVVNTNVQIDFPPTSRIENVTQADAVLEAVDLSRRQIAWRFRQKEQICFKQFFMNSCLLDAKDERRTDLARVKKSEVEANYFKRKNTVEEMDRALAEKNQNPSPSDVAP